MKTLKHILDELKIKSDKELREYIDKNYSNQKNIPLKIKKKANLNVDSENRIYEEKINFTKTIFDVAKLNILNSKKISFQNCIFMGSLRVGQKDNKDITEIFFDDVSIKEALYISGSFNISNCEISNISCPTVYIQNNELISNLYISICHIGLITFYNNKINKFQGIFNKINYLETYYCEFENVDFPNNQIVLSNYDATSLSQSKVNKIKRKHNYLYFNNSCNLDKLSNTEKFQKMNETSLFLLENSNYHLNRLEQAKLKYIQGLSSISNPITRLLYRFFGGLIIPSRIVIIIFITISLFSMLYFFFDADFCATNTNRNLSLGEAFYFSGTSFTTIGYGDIAPMYIWRYIAVLEGIIGLLLSSMFIISLTRKYID